MTLRQLIEIVGEQPWVLVGVFSALPVAAWLTGRLQPVGAGGTPPWRSIYAVLVYLACVPGVVAVVLAALHLFFSGANLLDLDLLVFFLPPLSMVATLALIGRRVDFEDVPGFDRLFGLMMMIGVSFLLALAVQKTRIWIFFGASITSLFVFAVIAFLILRWASRMAFGSRRPN